MVDRKAEIKVNFSMLNLLDTSTLWGIIAPIEMYATIAKKSGYAGIEYFPYRVPHLQMKKGLVTNNGVNSITSAHQSFRTEKDFEAVRKHPNPKLAAAAYITMPEKFASLKDLEKLQRELGHKIPVVVYPPNEWLGEKRPYIFERLDNKLIQPAPELLGAWGIQTTKQFINKIKNSDYKLCLDLFHIRRQVTQGFHTQFSRWQEVIPALLPYTKEVHLAVGRSDFQGPFDSAQELKDIYSGERKTDIVPMLELIREFGWTGSIVTEIPATSAKNLISNSKIATPSLLIQVHKQIVANINEIMS